MKEVLQQEIRFSIEQLRDAIAARSNSDKLLAIGFVTTDDVMTIGAKVLFDGDLPENAQDYQKLSPVEWVHSEENAFMKLNQYLPSMARLAEENEDGYSQRVRVVFDKFIAVLKHVDLRRKFGETLYLTFAGVDPNSVLEAEEKRFVKLMNPSSIFELWCDEFD